MTFKEMLEQEPSIIQSIAYEIELFKYNHNGEAPEKIFVSYPLHDKIIASYRLYSNRKEAIAMCGIPVQPYECEDNEFYLAERKSKLRRFLDDEKQIFLGREKTQNDR